MIVTIFGATGMVGRQLIIHSLAKGWQVRAFSRQAEQLIDRDLYEENFKAIKGYVFDAGDVAKAIKGSDAVLSALGGGIDGSDITRSLGMKNIVAQMEKHRLKRIVALGGLGVLDTSTGKGPIFQQEDYPKEYVAVGKEHYDAFLHLKNSSLDWSFFCAPNIIDKEADGRFEAIEEVPATKFEISSGNLALSMVQAIESGTYLHHRVGIGNL